MKVYRITVMNHPSWELSGRQAALVVAAKSRAAAVRAINAAGVRVTIGYMTTYGSETANVTDCAVALADPGVVFAHEMNDYSPDRRYVKVVPKTGDQR